MRRLRVLWRLLNDDHEVIDHLSDILDSLLRVETLLTEIRDDPERAR